MNDPTKIPHISSMTEFVMANVFREAKNKAVTEYNSLIQTELLKLRNNNDKQPLDEKDIIQLHLKVIDHVLQKTGTSLQPPQSQQAADDDEKQSGSQLNHAQRKVYNEFCDEVGHNQDVTKIGLSGIMYRILTNNKKLSYDYCSQYLIQGYNQKL